MSLSRHTFGPRDRARAGHLWRLFQDAAIEGSCRLGWPPARYREVEGSFIVRRMTVVHHREAVFGEPIVARTWVSTFKRGMLSERQIRLAVGAVPLASATQQWVYVAAPELKPARAPRPLLDAFVPVAADGEADVVLPPHVDRPGASFAVSLETWHTAMDPLGHANHPAYVDWADEAIARWMAGAGLDPQSLVPVAEEVTFRSGIVAPEPARVGVALVGSTADAAVFRVTVTGGDGRDCADGLFHRSTAGGPAPLFGLTPR